MRGAPDRDPAPCRADSVGGSDDHLRVIGGVATPPQNLPSGGDGGGASGRWRRFDHAASARRAPSGAHREVDATANRSGKRGSCPSTFGTASVGERSKRSNDQASRWLDSRPLRRASLPQGQGECSSVCFLRGSGRSWHSGCLHPMCRHWSADIAAASAGAENAVPVTTSPTGAEMRRLRAERTAIRLRRLRQPTVARTPERELSRHCSGSVCWKQQASWGNPDAAPMSRGNGRWKGA